MKAADDVTECEMAMGGAEDLGAAKAVVEAVALAWENSQDDAADVE